MKKYMLLILTAGTIAACQSSTNKETSSSDTSLLEKGLEVAGEVSTQQLDSMCYMDLGLAKNRDTVAVKLIIKGDDVTGNLMYLYYQKDGRFGRLKGKKKGDNIEAKWVYMQEGMIDSMDVAFKMDGENLLQKENSIDSKTGREHLPADAPYKHTYQKVDCNTLPNFDFDFGVYWFSTTNEHKDRSRKAKPVIAPYFCREKVDADEWSVQVEYAAKMSIAPYRQKFSAYRWVENYVTAYSFFLSAER